MMKDDVSVQRRGDLQVASRDSLDEPIGHKDLLEIESYIEQAGQDVFEHVEARRTGEYHPPDALGRVMFFQ